MSAQIPTADNELVETLPRRVTAIGTIGPVGAAYTVYEKNWFCAECKNENYARRQRCHRCRAAKPENCDSLVVQSATGEKNLWREAVDPVSRHIYYYNIETKETKWERPAEMGIAPHSKLYAKIRILILSFSIGTGWFGRGMAGLDNANKYEEQNKVYMQRLARKQLDQMPLKNSQLEGAYEYNIWYHKFIGDNWQDERSNEPAETKCVLESDAGRTKADEAKKTNRYFCMHFARGMCAKGSDCSYFHRLPTREDEVRVGMMHDCFGRKRHATDRDDMSGVGNFTKNSRTLYVGGLKNVSADVAASLEQQLWKYFGEWGEVENVNVIHRLSIAFVRYRHRISAEFAKEAMCNQSLDNDEVLSIRWAFDDPNPVAKKSAQRSDHDAIVGMLRSKGVSTKQSAFYYPEDYNLQNPKKQKHDSVNTLTGCDAHDEYPNTDEQFQSQTANDNIEK